MPTVKKNALSAESEMISGEISFVDDIELKRFKNDTKTLLKEIKGCHMSKKRQIEHWFAKLIDNTSQEILDMPINKCLEDYLKSKAAEASKEANANVDDQIVDQSLSDEPAPKSKPVDANVTTNLDYTNEIE
jgi:hypothetical protein